MWDKSNNICQKNTEDKNEKNKKKSPSAKQKLLRQ